jgi:hypothetical protein
MQATIQATTQSTEPYELYEQATEQATGQATMKETLSTLDEESWEVLDDFDSFICQKYSEGYCENFYEKSQTYDEFREKCQRHYNEHLAQRLHFIQWKRDWMMKKHEEKGFVQSWPDFLEVQLRKQELSVPTPEALAFTIVQHKRLTWKFECQFYASQPTWEQFFEKNSEEIEELETGTFVNDILDAVKMILHLYSINKQIANSK